jgi:hypothetical protein
MRWSAAQSLAWIIRKKPLELRVWLTEMGPDIEPAGKMLAEAIVLVMYAHGAGQSLTRLSSRYPTTNFAFQDSH